jgi:chromosome segregation ATPase
MGEEDDMSDEWGKEFDNPPVCPTVHARIVKERDTLAERVKELREEIEVSNFERDSLKAENASLAERVKDADAFIEIFAPDNKNVVTAMVEAQRVIKERDSLKSQLDNAINAYDSCAVERDDLKEKLAAKDRQLERAKVSWTAHVQDGLAAEGMGLSGEALEAQFSFEVLEEPK